MALSLSVPSYLLGTAATLAMTVRALGGIIGVTIFTAIQTPKLTDALVDRIPAALTSVGASASLTEPVIIALGIPNPAALAMVPGLPPSAIPAILAAQAAAEADSYRLVWVTLAILILSTAIMTCFTKSVKDEMTAHVESAIEPSAIRNEQMVK